MIRPPRLAEAVLTWLLPASQREEILGDLAEAHGRRAERGPAAAALWYWAQTLLVPGWLLLSSVGSLRPEWPEMRRTARSLVRAPGFTLVAVLSLGLGIGATTAISGAIRSLLFMNLPVDRPEELSLVYHTWPEEWERSQYGSSSTEDPVDGTSVVSNISWPAYEVLTGAVPEDAAVAAFAFVRELAVSTGDGPAQVAGGMMVSGNYFTTLRLETELGRGLTPADDQPGAPPVVVLSHSFWRSAYGADPSVLGRSVRLNGDPFTVVGVSGEGYVGLSPAGFFSATDLTVPMSTAAGFLSMRLPPGATLRTAAQHHWIRLLARLPQGADVGSISREWSSVLSRHMAEAGVFAAGDAGDMQIRMLDGRRGLDSLRRSTKGPLAMLSAAVGLVLLIACANLATLLLSRGAARTQELAVRRAIGASRWELARPLVVESLLLATAGGGLGLLIALRGGPLIVASLTGGGTPALHYEVDGFMIGSAVAASLLAATISAWVPALRMMRTEPGPHLGARSRGSAQRHGVGRALIATQIAISVPLVVGAGLFLKTLNNLVSIDPGFGAEDVVVFRLDASLVAEDDAAQARIYQQVLEDLQVAPAVRSAALVENVLVSGWQSNTLVEVDGQESMMDMNAVSPGFFKTMGIRLLSGRELTDADHAESSPVALVNQTAEQVLFGGRALGRSFRIAEGRDVEIVGVVADTRYSSLRDKIEPAFYDPWVQRAGGLYAAHYAVVSGAPMNQIQTTVREVVDRAAPGLPVAALRAQTEDLAAQAASERVFARLLSGFGLFALLLACVGLHGLMSFAVSQRKAEMGVRLALGASPGSILAMILRQVLLLTLFGLVAGLVMAFLLGPLIRNMLFGVEPTDVSTLVLSALVMVGVALVAGSVPAYRASRVDPLKSLSV